MLSLTFVETVAGLLLGFTATLPGCCASQLQSARQKIGAETVRAPGD